MKKNCSFFYSICLLLVSATLLAQDGPEPLPIEPPAPIDDYIPLLIVVGLCLAFFVIFKRRKAIDTSSL